MIEIVRRTSRNVKRWQSGDMCLRWTAAGMLDALPDHDRHVNLALDRGLPLGEPPALWDS